MLPQAAGLTDMAANPALVAGPDRTLVPAPFQGEHIALGRQGVELALDNVQTRSGKCVSAALMHLQDFDTARSPLKCKCLTSNTIRPFIQRRTCHTWNKLHICCACPQGRRVQACLLDNIVLRYIYVCKCHARWSPKGSLWLTNLRMVFVADQSDPGSGLRAFDIPLVYITADRFNQPIFVCNNLTGAGCAQSCRLAWCPFLRAWTTTSVLCSRARTVATGSEVKLAVSVTNEVRRSAQSSSSELHADST